MAVMVIVCCVFADTGVNADVHTDINTSINTSINTGTGAGAVSDAIREPITAAYVVLDRRGRRVQVDGFLLEWSPENALRWPNSSSSWMWDAVNTVDGVAGYFSSPVAPSCSGWVFAARAVNTGRAAEFRVPEQAADEIFAFDKGGFESEGVYTVEWLVPWDFWGGIDGEYALMLDAASVCGDTLSPIILSVGRWSPSSSESSSSSSVYLVMALTAGLTIGLVVYRRRRNLR